MEFIVICYESSVAECLAVYCTCFAFKGMVRGVVEEQGTISRFDVDGGFEMACFCKVDSGVKEVDGVW